MVMMHQLLKHLPKSFLFTMAAILAVGCSPYASNAQRKATQGALLGGVTGAIIGNQSGEAGKGAALGAGLGAAGGYAVGNEQDKRR
jgi:uncharacterized protein YcfJ